MDFADIQGWLGAAKDTLDLLKSAAVLLPKGEKRAEIEGRLALLKIPSRVATRN